MKISGGVSLYFRTPPFSVQFDSL